MWGRAPTPPTLCRRRSPAAEVRGDRQRDSRDVDGLDRGDLQRGLCGLLRTRKRNGAALERCTAVEARNAKQRQRKLMSHQPVVLLVLRCGHRPFFVDPLEHRCHPVDWKRDADLEGNHRNPRWRQRV